MVRSRSLPEGSEVSGSVSPCSYRRPVFDLVPVSSVVPLRHRNNFVGVGPCPVRAVSVARAFVVSPRLLDPQTRDSDRTLVHRSTVRDPLHEDSQRGRRCSVRPSLTRKKCRCTLDYARSLSVDPFRPPHVSGDYTVYLLSTDYRTSSVCGTCPSADACPTVVPSVPEPGPTRLRGVVPTPLPTALPPLVC